MPQSQGFSLRCCADMQASETKGLVWGVFLNALMPKFLYGI